MCRMRCASLESSDFVYLRRGVKGSTSVKSVKAFQHVQKKHPKMCRRLTSENKYRFKEECAYTHKRVNYEVNVLKDKVDMLEKKLKYLTMKVEI